MEKLEAHQQHSKLISLTPVSFYGKGLPRPRVIPSNSDFQNEFKQESVMGGLLDWARRTNWKKGGISFQHTKRIASAPSEKPNRKKYGEASGPKGATKKRTLKDESPKKLNVSQKQRAEEKKETISMGQKLKDMAIYNWSDVDTSDSDEEAELQHQLQTRKRRSVKNSEHPDKNFLFSPSRRLLRSSKLRKLDEENKKLGSYQIEEVEMDGFLSD